MSDQQITPKMVRDFTDLRDDIHALAGRAAKVAPEVAGVLYTLSGTMYAGDVKYIDELADITQAFAKRVKVDLIAKRDAA